MTASMRYAKMVIKKQEKQRLQATEAGLGAAPLG